MPYRPTYLPDGRKAYDPQRTMIDIHDEWEAFEQKVRDEGETSFLAIRLRSRELWRQEEERKETWRDWQVRVWKPRMAALAASKPDLELTPEEWAYLAESLEGANHPLAQSIHKKAVTRGL